MRRGWHVSLVGAASFLWRGFIFVGCRSGFIWGAVSSLFGVGAVPSILGELSSASALVCSVVWSESGLIFFCEEAASLHGIMFLLLAYEDRRSLDLPGVCQGDPEKKQQLTGLFLIFRFVLDNRQRLELVYEDQQSSDLPG